MPKLRPSQHGPFTGGIVAASGAYIQPAGTVPRASNLIGIKRGSLSTCDGSSILAWHYIAPVAPPGPATITGVTPTSGYVGTSVEIDGSNFGGFSGSVTFNGVSAVINSWSPTKIVVAVPAGASTGELVVTTAGGQTASGGTFTFLGVLPNAPVITGISPVSGPAGTTQVTISGSNFGSIQSTVTFNGVPVSTWGSWSDTSVTVTVPANATTGPVVINIGGINSNADFIFTVTSTSQPPPGPPPAGTTLNLANIVGGVTVPAGHTGSGHPGISFSLQTTWPSTLAEGDTVQVSGTGIYDGLYVVGGLSPGPDDYGMTLVAGSNSATAIVLNTGTVTFP